MKRFLAVTVAFLISACSNQPTPEQGAVVGGLSGAGVGAIAGAPSGNAGAGAVIGAAAGAATGAVVGSQTPDKQQIIEYQDEYIQLQQQQIHKQGKEVDQIKRQQYWDQRLQDHK